MMPPASTLSAPPRKMSLMIADAMSSGKAAMLSASTTSPPIA
jgi:hypothetical protein